MKGIIRRVLSTRKGRITAATGIVTLVIASAAIAYVLSNLTGSASASGGTLPTQATSTDVSSVLVFDNGIAGSPFDATSLHVGGTVPYALTIDVSKVPVGTNTITGVTLTAAPSNPSTCPASDFTVSNTQSYPMTVTQGAGTAVLASGNVSLANDPSVNQDGCAGQTVTLSATVQ